MEIELKNDNWNKNSLKRTKERISEHNGKKYGWEGFCASLELVNVDSIIFWWSCI